jgi:hypothetical protein
MCAHGLRGDNQLGGVPTVGPPSVSTRNTPSSRLSGGHPDKVLQQVQDFVDAGAQHIVVMFTDVADSPNDSPATSSPSSPRTSIAARRGSSTRARTTLRRGGSHRR